MPGEELVGCAAHWRSGLLRPANHAFAKEQAAMTPKQRLRLNDLDLTVTDPFERTTQCIYDEIFVGGT